jgi:hypothetical protein
MAQPANLKACFIYVGPHWAMWGWDLRTRRGPAGARRKRAISRALTTPVCGNRSKPADTLAHGRPAGGPGAVNVIFYPPPFDFYGTRPLEAAKKHPNVIFLPMPSGFKRAPQTCLPYMGPIFYQILLPETGPDGGVPLTKSGQGWGYVGGFSPIPRA